MNYEDMTTEELIQLAKERGILPKEGETNENH